MDKVAKYNASQNQIAQQASAQMLNKASQDKLQQTKIVQQAAANEVLSTKVDKDGSNSSSYSGRGTYNKKYQDQDTDNESAKSIEVTDPRLGIHIDITR